MNCMSKLDVSYKLFGRSIPDIHERFNNLVTWYKSRSSIKYQGRSITNEALGNAIVLRFLELPPEDQHRILAEYIPKLESMVDKDEDANPTSKLPFGASHRPVGSAVKPPIEERMRAQGKTTKAAPKADREGGTRRPGDDTKKHKGTR